MDWLINWAQGQGPVGIVAILLVFGLLYQTQQLAKKDAKLEAKDAKLDSREAELVKVHEDRVKDQQAMSQVLDRVTTSAKEMAVEATQLVGSQNLANEQTRSTLMAQTKSLEDLTRATDRLSQQLQQQQQTLQQLVWQGSKQ